MHENANRLVDRGVEPDVAAFLVKCARAGRVVDVIQQFDQYERRPADPARWFQERLLHGSFNRDVSKFGQQIRQAPKGSGRATRRFLLKRPKRRSKQPQPRSPVGAVID